MYITNSIRRFLQLGSLAFIFALGTTAASAQVGLGMSPMRLELRMNAGTQYSGALNLSNTANAKLRIRTELLDFFIDGEDTPQFGREWKQETPYSCRKWLSINPMEIEAPESSQVIARYTIRVPEGTPEGGYHCAAGFTTLPPAEQVSGTGLHMAVRVVTAFYVVVGAPTVQGALKEIKLEPVAPDAKNPAPGWQAVVVVDNPTLVHFRPQGQLALIDGSGKVLETLDFPQLPVLPKRSQRFIFKLKTGMNDASYTLRARVDVGTGILQEGTASVVVPKSGH